MRKLWINDVLGPTGQDVSKDISKNVSWDVGQDVISAMWARYPAPVGPNRDNVEACCESHAFHVVRLHVLLHGFCARSQLYDTWRTVKVNIYAFLKALAANSSS